MPTLTELAYDFALDLAEDAQTGTCPEGHDLPPSDPRHHRLGTHLMCPTCWAWHAARKQPHPDQQNYVRSVLAEQRELAGEANLDTIAAEIVRIFGTGTPVGPTGSIFFTELTSAAIRCAYMLNISTSRRRRTLLEVIGYLFLDPKVAVGTVPAGWASAHLPARDGRGCGHTGRDCGCSYPDHGDDSVPF